MEERTEIRVGYSIGNPPKTGEKIGSGTNAGTVVSTHVHVDERGNVTNVALIEFSIQNSDSSHESSTS